jgi:hypothetical protein
MCASLQLVDEVYPAQRVMAEAVYGSPLMQPLYAFADSLLPNPAGFFGTRDPFLCHFDSSVPPHYKKEACGESPRGLFLERMIQVSNTGRTAHLLIWQTRGYPVI